MLNSTALAAIPLTVMGCTNPECLIDKAEDALQPSIAQIQTAQARGPVSHDDLAAAVKKVDAQFGGKSGIAVFDGDSMQSAGVTGGYPAWSTSKVPIAIAAEQKGTATLDLLNKAITYSDNAAAQQLWASLGDSVAAGEAAEKVLAEGGDNQTVYPSTHPRPGYTFFGQLDWTLENQARFSYNLPRIKGAAPVIKAMMTPDPAQQYGLRTLPGTAMKGGWGPDKTGAYDVLQIGRTNLHGHEVGIAIYAHPDAGTYEDAQRALTALVDEVARH